LPFAGIGLPFAVCRLPIEKIYSEEKIKWANGKRQTVFRAPSIWDAFFRRFYFYSIFEHQCCVVVS
jgi:hypothetical protein